MSRTIIITESQLHILREFENNEFLHGDFEKNLNIYLNELHDNPTHPSYPDYFKKFNISEKLLLNKMLDLGLLTKKERFIEPTNAEGKKRSMHTIQYIKHNNNYNNNIDTLFNTFKKDIQSNKLNEDGECGLNIGTSDGSGGITLPAFGDNSLVRKAKYNSQRKGDITQQVSNVDLSKTTDRHPGFSVERKK